MKQREGGRQIRKESKRKLYGKEINKKIKMIKPEIGMKVGQ